MGLGAAKTRNEASSRLVIGAGKSRYKTRTLSRDNNEG